MGIYIGNIKQVPIDSGTFFNFKPIAQVQNHRIFELSAQEQTDLLPESEKRDIMLNYNWHDNDEQRRMESIFSEKTLIIFEFDLSDLQANFKPNGDRNQTGYKISAMEMLDAGKIRPIGTSGIYFPIYKDEVSDFTNDAIVEIKSPWVVAGSRVFVEMDDFWAGPYEVGYRDYTSSYYIKPEIREQKYTVSGYNSDQMNKFTLTEGYWGSSENSWELLSPKADAEIEQRDFISDAVLIESFKSSVKSRITVDGKIDLGDIPALLEQYERSELSGSILTEATRRSRLNRLVSIMSSEEDVDETLRTVTDFICDLLIKYQSSPNVDDWLQALIEKHPQLLDQLQSSQVISKHITELENSLENLTAQKTALEQEIEETQKRAEAVDQQAIEEKKKAMLEQEAEYAALSERIEAGRKLLGIVGNIGELQGQYKTLQDQVNKISTHKDFISSETRNLELQFQQMISRPHDDMVKIAFDGFMASKMLHAASEWEAEQSNNQSLDFTNKIATIELQDKTPEQLVEYLCKLVQVRRPNYRRNTIINIAICLTQSFLTVFSGEPGCGKTSICNIFGEVLGLNKMSELFDYPTVDQDYVNRYVEVSVERGWTSKRDFVGYYNPLSKSFDKSNRRIYDALHQLDTEKRAGVLNLPYIILLDEANLSPMEYYWSDFMNICDDLNDHSKVNLGEDYVFGIPETLHFVATINNDHTTETLSPRLIDRAWIITLPEMRDYTSSIGEEYIPTEMIELISWKSLHNAFVPEADACVFTADIQKCYEAIIAKLREKRISVSPRVDAAIKRYWAVASKYFEMDDTKTSVATIALDYAIAQRILPKIIGNGEDFEKWLKELRSLCSNNGLNMSADMLREIIDRGNQQMKYYQFFN